jgi:hypothetical protein
MGGQVPLEGLVLLGARVLAALHDAAVDAVLPLEHRLGGLRPLVQLLVLVGAPLGCAEDLFTHRAEHEAFDPPLVCLTLASAQVIFH